MTIKCKFKQYISICDDFGHATRNLVIHGEKDTKKIRQTGIQRLNKVHMQTWKLRRYVSADNTCSIYSHTLAA